jgi:hypothetical protein
MCSSEGRSFADQEHGLAEQLGNLFEDEDGSDASAPVEQPPSQSARELAAETCLFAGRMFGTRRE